MTDLTPELADLIARRFAVLGEPTRLRLLNLMHASGEASVGELVEATGGTQANVSKHLGCCSRERMVARRREGSPGALLDRRSDPDHALRRGLRRRSRAAPRAQLDGRDAGGRPDDLPPDHPRRPRLRLLSRRRREGRRGGGRRSAVRDRRVPRSWPATSGVSIEHILETHNHADHVSGHGRLAAATGATIYIHREAEPDYEHEAIDDGFELEVGELLIRALHTPGHRPEHTAFALIDRRRGDEPWAVLTGDTLFVNDVARPDLAIEEREGARGIFHSLQDKLLSLPDDCEVWPGHLGGSMCGGPGMDMKISSTIGFEREHNPTLAITDEEEFVEQAVAKLGPQPPNFEAIVELNKGPLVTEGTEVLPLAPRQVEQKRPDGRSVVDARTDQQFDDAHIPGAVCIPMLARRASARSSPGSPTAIRRSCSSVATTTTAVARRGSRSPSGSRSSPASSAAG